MHPAGHLSPAWISQAPTFIQAHTMRLLAKVYSTHRTIHRNRLYLTLCRWVYLHFAFRRNVQGWSARFAGENLRVETVALAWASCARKSRLCFGKNTEISAMEK